MTPAFTLTSLRPVDTSCVHRMRMFLNQTVWIPLAAIHVCACVGVGSLPLMKGKIVKRVLDLQDGKTR